MSWRASTGTAFLCLAPFLLSNAAIAQLPQLDALSSRLAKEMKPLKPRLVAVVDFRPPYGTRMPQGHYFAWLLSAILQDRQRKKLNVADHGAFDTDLASLRLAPEVLSSGDNLRAAAPKIGADWLITGSIEKRGNSYFLEIVPIRVADLKSLGPVSTIIESNEFFEAMLKPLPSDVPFLQGSMKSGDVTMPSCVRCPDPEYTDLARGNRIQGAILFNVLISAEGQAAQIQPIRLLGNGLDQKAFEAIKKWKFKPARWKKGGTPVAVVVPIEVTFRLY
jgi:TonB family protein